VVPGGGRVRRSRGWVPRGPAGGAGVPAIETRAAPRGVECRGPSTFFSPSPSGGGGPREGENCGGVRGGGGAGWGGLSAAGCAMGVALSGVGGPGGVLWGGRAFVSASVVTTSGWGGPGGRDHGCVIARRGVPVAGGGCVGPLGDYIRAAASVPCAAAHSGRSRVAGAAPSWGKDVVRGRHAAAQWVAWVRVVAEMCASVGGRK